MVTLRLRSSELEATAEALTAIASTLEAQSADRETSWNELPTFTDADSLLAGIERLHRHNSTLSQTAERIAKAAGVLFSTASAVRILESYLHTMEKVTDYSPTVTMFLNQIARLGDLLDFMCATQIESLCTPIAPTPLKKLADFDDLPATAIHEFNLMNAPPEIQAFAAANPDVTLLETTDGILVAALGDIDSADSIATIVAGVNSSDPAHWQGNLNRARTIHQTTGAATVMWMGYTAPASIPNAIASRAAEAGGRELRVFQETLAARNPHQRRVAVGYSYGSVVVGNGASKSSGGFDAVVLVGSPGSGVRHARDLDAEVYAVTGTRDPIGLAATGFGGVHGTDPTSPWFGSTVWESTSSHSGYWDDPDFLTNLERVINK